VLGTEPQRYYEVAATDHATPPTPIDEHLLTPGARTQPMPPLPLAPAATDDPDAHMLIRTLLEEVAEAPIVSERGYEGVPGDSVRLSMLAELDRLPVSARAQTGRFVDEAMRVVSADTSGDIVWSLRSVRGNAGQAHLAYGACSRPYSDLIRTGLETWLTLRHHDVLAVTGDSENLTSVAILLTPSERSGRPWDTTAMSLRGDLDLSESDIEELRQIWPDSGFVDVSGFDSTASRARHRCSPASCRRAERTARARHRRLHTSRARHGRAIPRAPR
jgi:hypothetical protein